MIPLIEQMKKLSVRSKTTKIQKAVTKLVHSKKINARRRRRQRRTLASMVTAKFCMMRYKVSY